MTSIPPGEQRLPLATVVGWGFADTGINVFFIAKQLLIFAFMVQYLSVPPAMAGGITSAILLFDMITDPVIGYLSDRTRTRWGRRIPYLIIGAPIMAAALVGLFAVPDELQGFGAALWVAGFFAIATVGFTLVAIPYSAMPAEMTHTPAERSRLTAYRMIASSIGILLAGAAFPAMVSLAASNGWAQSERGAHMVAALILSPLIIGPIWIAAIASLGAPRVETPGNTPVKVQVAAVWRNKPFIWLAAVYGFLTLGIAIMTAGIPFAALYLVTDNGASLFSGMASGLGNQALMFLLFVIGSILSQPLWLVLSKRLGKPMALVIGTICYAIALTALFAILPGTDLTLVCLIILMVGVFNGAYQQIPWALMPDLIDLTTKSEGKNLEGVFAASWLFGQKVAGALGPAILGLALASAGWIEASGGFVAQSPEAISTLRWVMTLLPALLLLATAITYALTFKKVALSTV